jgi:hypothetical protein
VRKSPTRPTWSARRLHVFALALTLGGQLAPDCGGVSGIRFHEPAADALRADGAVQVSARTGEDLGEASLELAIEEIGLAFALGLTPPFLDETGVVLLDGHPIVVTGFSVFTADGSRHVQASLAGLPPGLFRLAVSGRDPRTGVSSQAHVSFRVVDSFSLEATDLPAAGLPGGATVSESEGILANASLGQAIAAPPLATLGGHTIRSGHVEKAEALIAGGP